METKLYLLRLFTELSKKPFTANTEVCHCVVGADYTTVATINAGRRLARYCK